MDWDIHRWICSGECRALSVKVKLLIYWSIHVSTLTQSHELWVETKKKESTDTSERNELAGLSIRNLK